MQSHFQKIHYMVVLKKSFADSLLVLITLSKLRRMFKSGQYINAWDHLFSVHAKFSEKPTFLTPWYAHLDGRTRGWEMLIFPEDFSFLWCF